MSSNTSYIDCFLLLICNIFFILLPSKTCLIIRTYSYLNIRKWFLVQLKAIIISTLTTECIDSKRRHTWHFLYQLAEAKVTTQLLYPVVCHIVVYLCLGIFFYGYVNYTSHVSVSRFYFKHDCENYRYEIFYILLDRTDYSKFVTQPTM